MAMGFLFSAFGWAYVIGQVPGGLILDRFGSGKVYGTVILVWTTVIILHALTGYLTPVVAFISLFLLRILCGFITAPVFPANARIVSEWFPRLKGEGLPPYSVHLNTLRLSYLDRSSVL